jgi:hypothetical protein
VWHNPHVRFSEAAIAQPAAGPLTSEHVERAANQGVVTFVSHPSIRVSPAPGARLMAAVGVGTLEDGHTVLVMKSGRTDLTNAASLEPLSALVYRPEWRLPLPGLGAEYPNAIAAIATKDELERFAKWERTKNMLFVLLYVGFMGHAVYVVISMRRWLRVSRLKKGVHAL